jgi:hypothetical protein
VELKSAEGQGDPLQLSCAWNDGDVVALMVARALGCSAVDFVLVFDVPQQP